MKKYAQIFVACSIALCMVSQSAGQTVRASEFHIVGPGGGGAMFHPTVDPRDTNEVLVACDMTGAYISHDGGRSWRMFNLRGTVRFFAFDPLRPHVIYAATRALWRSTDDGESWDLFWPKPSTVDGVSMNSDHADETVLSASNPLGEIVALAIDPADSRILTAAAVKDGAAAIYVSKDGGGDWEKATALAETPQKIWIDPHSPAGDRDLYVAGKTSVTVRQQGKWQSRPAPAGVAFIDVSAGFSSPHGIRLYAASDAGIYVSNDGAVTWTAATLPGKGARIDAIAASLDHPESAYVSYRHLQLDGKSWMGVARTRDGGITWALVWQEDKTVAPNLHDAWLAEQFGPDWGGNPLGLGVAEQDPNLAYGTDYGRTMQTTDGGASWYGVYSSHVQGADWVSTGLDVTTNYGYLFDPFDARRRFIPTTDIGLFRSEDDGRTWTRSMTGVPRAWSNTAYWVAFDPDVQGKMWGVMSGVHDLPRPKMWRTRGIAAYKGGVCVSLDGGRTWKTSNQGMPETAPTHILLDPSSPAGKRVLWVAAMGRGVYKSSDDGVTWTLKNNGIVQHEPFAWRLARAADGTLYVMVARRSEDGSIGTAGDGAVYKSTDGAESWTPVKLPAETNGPNGLAIDPHDPQRLYLAAWGRASGTEGTGGGIYLSTDGGGTWKNVLDRDQHIYDVTIDPRDAGTLYAAGFESSAWRSNDRGEHWTRIPGYNFKWGHRVMPDLMDPGMIYISTFGGGVWHGPSVGAEGRADIATPVLQPGH
ncbi:MAG: hypothetical protein ABSA48_16285 [Terracidiphilus sp.]|jgi:photosystem II stability/assembly factor-like uncharacterized protein